MNASEQRAAIALAYEQFKTIGKPCVRDELNTYDALLFEYACRKGIAIGLAWAKTEVRVAVEEMK